jgi:hypothetical protein
MPSELQLFVAEAEEKTGCHVQILPDKSAAQFDNLELRITLDGHCEAIISFAGVEISRCALIHELLAHHAPHPAGMHRHVHRRRDVGFERKGVAVAFVVLAPTARRGIDRDDQRFPAQVTRARDHFVGARLILPRVELEPLARIGHFLADFFHGGQCARGQLKGYARRGSGPRQLHLPLIPHQSGTARGGDPERQLDALAEDLGAKVTRRPVVEKARVQFYPLKRRTVFFD